MQQKMNATMGSHQVKIILEKYFSLQNMSVLVNNRVQLHLCIQSHTKQRQEAIETGR